MSIHQVEDEERYLAPPVLNFKTIGNYLATRLPTLFDIPMLHQERKWYQVLNPIPGLKTVSREDWEFFALGFFAWTLDSLDFFCVSTSASQIAHTLDVDITQISWGVTLVLMLRSVSATIFGLIADHYGRKWPYIVICLLFVVVELGTGFVKTYQQFLGVRAIFGILMGAMYPIASVTALENVPQAARSILSGLFLPGYNLGYLLSAVFFRAFEFSYKGNEGWRALFWFSAGLPVPLIVCRLLCPESPVYLKMKADKKLQAQLDLENGVPPKKKWDLTVFHTLKTEWLMIIYLIIFTAAFTFISHGSQDLYPTYLTNQRLVDLDTRTIITVVTNLGAICGGVFFGQVTELFGRRLTIIFTMIWAAAFLYPSFFMANFSAMLGGYFLLTFGTMGFSGVLPIHILELINPTHRAFLSGVVYQLGNLALSASMTIEAQLGERFPIEGKAPGTYNYGLVMAIFCGSVFGFTVLIVFFGPERFHRNLGTKYLDDYAESETSLIALEVKPEVEYKE